jgi:TonB family protein
MSGSPTRNRRLVLSCFLAVVGVPLCAALDGATAANVQALVAKDKFTEAVALVEPAFRQADPDALLLMGLFQAVGAGVTQDQQAAQGHWKQAAHLGQRDAIRLLLPMIEDPFQRTWWQEQLATAAASEFKVPVSLVQAHRDGLAANEQVALAWNEAEAVRNNPLALFNLYALRRHRYEWVAQRKEELLAPLKKAALAGFAPALKELGNIYTADPEGFKNPMRLVAADDKLASSYLKRAADLGDDGAQLLWAHRLRAGSAGGKESPELALEYYRRASEHGNAYAPYFIFQAYEEGNGVPKNETVALEFLKLAADRDNDTAAAVLAHRLFYGDRAPKDEKTAIAYLMRMLVTSMTPRDDAIALVAFAYGYGRGLPRDTVAAFKWANWAAGKGSTDAKYQVGLQYLSGQGVEMDPIAGYVNVLAAASRGHVGARIIAATCRSRGIGTARDVPEAIKELEAVRLAGSDETGEATLNLALIRMGEGGPDFYDRSAAMALLAAADTGGQADAHFLHRVLQAELVADEAQARAEFARAFADAKQDGSMLAAGFLHRADGDVDRAAGFLMEAPEKMDEDEIQQRLANLGRPSESSGPRPVYLPKPRYPLLMMLMNREGDAVVEFVIDEAGRVTEPRLVSDTHVLFGDRAKDTVLSWRFAPAFRDGHPTKILVSQKIEFRLDGPQPTAAK